MDGSLVELFVSQRDNGLDLVHCITTFYYYYNNIFLNERGVFVRIV